MTTTLRISPDLALPIDAVTGTFGILATKGAGKSNAAVVMAEEMYDAGVPWVAIDPKGDWYGVRSSADGKKPGLSIPVLGGRHHDALIDPREGAQWADVVLRNRLSCVVDVSQFTKAETTRFLNDFGAYLFRHADDDGAEPLHLFLEEAHEYLPQQVRGDQAQLVGTWQRIVKQGRFKGLGCTLVSQRSSSLNKDVLELVDTLIVLRTIGPRSRDAIKAWVKDQDVDEGLLASLPTLADGEAWVWSPGALRIMERVRFRRRRTFDSGATPKVGQARRAPARLADVDLAAIKEQMAESIERAKAEDPKELQKRIRQLEREIAERPTVEPERVEVPVEVEVIPDGLASVVRSTAAGLTERAEGLRGAADELADAAQGLDDMLAGLTDRVVGTIGRTPDQMRAARQTSPRPAPARPERQQRPQRTAPPRQPAEPAGDVATDGLTDPQQRVLDAIAWWNAVGFPQPTKHQVGFIAGYRVGKRIGGKYGATLGDLNSAGLIDYPAQGVVVLTGAGAALAGHVDVEPTTEGLQAAIFARLTEPESRVLQAIIDAHPDDIAKLDAGDAAGYTVGTRIGGKFGTVLGRLHTLGLTEYPRPGYVVASAVLFLENAR